MKQLLRSVMTLGLAFAVAGCSIMGGDDGADVQLNIMVDKQVNPDPSGRASPLVIKVYHLNDKLAFETKDFFSIYDATDKDVKKAIVAQKEYQLNPGHEIHKAILTEPQTQYIGIVAAFRDIEIAKWRAVAKVTPDEEHNVTFTLKGVRIEVKAEEL